MQIEDINVFHVNAGWRPWTFVKIITKCGIVGWSECSDSHGSPKGIHGVVDDLTPLLISKDPRNINSNLTFLHSRTRQSPGSVVQKAIAAMENAMWDIKAKDLNVPVFELLGGALRDEIPLYWSHFGTTRVRAAKLVDKKPIRSLLDVPNLCEEFLNSGFKALKTNMAILSDNPYIYMPGFEKSIGGPQLNPDQEILIATEKWISAIRENVGPDISIALDLNFNFKSEGFVKLASILEKFDLSWLEIDCYDPVALQKIRTSINTPIVSCENLYGSRAYKPYFNNYSMDIASIDVIWNGMSESLRIAHLADLHEMNICTHNFNGHLSTLISGHLSALVPNLRIAEVDVDDVPWRDELFTALPNISDGYLQLSNLAGWGIEVNEKVLQKYKWNN